MISNLYLDEKPAQNRRENLDREVHILSQIDTATSVTLIEALQTRNGFIIVQDLVNGGTLNNFLGARE